MTNIIVRVIVSNIINVDATMLVRILSNVLSLTVVYFIDSQPYIISFFVLVSRMAGQVNLS